MPHIGVTHSLNGFQKPHPTAKCALESRSCTNSYSSDECTLHGQSSKLLDEKTANSQWGVSSSPTKLKEKELVHAMALTGFQTQDPIANWTPENSCCKTTYSSKEWPIYDKSKKFGQDRTVMNDWIVSSSHTKTKEKDLEQTMTVPADTLSNKKPPELDRKYKQFLKRQDRVEYDATNAMFIMNTDFELDPKPDIWLYFLVKAHYLLPSISYPNIGFKFNSLNVDEQITNLCHSAKKELDKQKFRFLFVFLKSLQVIFFVTHGRFPMAKNVLHSLEHKVSKMDDCNFTAWYYLAKAFYTMINQQSLAHNEVNRNQNEYVIVQNLQKARMGFLINEGYFSWEGTMCIWWMFLVRSGASFWSSRQRFEHVTFARSLRKEDETDAENYLKMFKTESKDLDQFPKDNKHQSKFVDMFRQKLRYSTEKTDSKPSQSEIGSQLEDLYNEFRRKARRQTPGCVQRTMKSEYHHRIVIYTTSKTSDEFKQFLRDVGYYTNASLYRIEIMKGPIVPLGKRKKKGNNSMPLANSEGCCRIIVGKQMTLGGVLLKCSQEKWQNGTMHRHLDVLMNHQKTNTWTSGILVKDKNSDDIFILTCGHCLTKEDLSEAKLSFLSAYEQQNIKVANKFDKILEEVCCSNYKGFYGGFQRDKDEEALYIADVLLLPVNEDFLNSPNVDMTIRKPASVAEGATAYPTPTCKPVDMKIFTGDIAELHGMTVSIRGSLSGSMDNVGTLVDTNIGDLNIPDINGEYVLCEGLFAINLNNEYTSKHMQRVAMEGDSGGLVFGKHPKSNECFALGLIYGKNLYEHENKTTGETYQFLTYCTPLSMNTAYIEKTYGLDIEYYKHNKSQVTCDTKATPVSPSKSPLSKRGSGICSSGYSSMAENNKIMNEEINSRRDVHSPQTSQKVRFAQIKRSFSAPSLVCGLASSSAFTSRPRWHRYGSSIDSRYNSTPILRHGGGCQLFPLAPLFRKKSVPESDCSYDGSSESLSIGHIWV